MKGYGFNSDFIEANVDGVPCKVQSFDLDSFTCITGPKNAPSTGKYFAGQHGLRRKYFNTTYDLDYNYLLNSTDYTEMLAVDLEAPYNVKLKGYGNVYSGYFKPPIDGRYRFYVSCDDYCKLFMSNTTLDPTKKNLIF